MTDYRIYQSIADDEGCEIESDRWDADNLHDAIRDLSGTRTSHCDGVAYTLANYTNWNATLHLTVQNGTEFMTGDSEGRTLCIIGITRPSARRLANLLNFQWSA